MERFLDGLAYAVKHACVGVLSTVCFLGVAACTVGVLSSDKWYLLVMAWGFMAICAAYIWAQDRLG